MVVQARLIVLCLGLGLGLGAALAGCGPVRPASTPGVQTGAWVSMALPALDGGEVDLAAHRGELVVVHFFTTWSLSAQVDVPELHAARAALPAGSVYLLGVGLDPEGYKFVAPWRDAVGADYQIVLGTPEIVAGQTPFGSVMTAVPRTYVLDRAGRIAWGRIGQLPPGELTKVLQDLEKRSARP